MPDSTLSTGRKLQVAAVLVFGGAALVYGGYTIWQQIHSPFRVPAPIANIAEIIGQSEEEELAQLKQQDSDQDTLSDYDEIHIYNTGPYLADTDSDGINDAQEIKAGTDPTCAPGADCRGIRLVTPETKISDLFPQFSDSNITLKDKTLQEFRAILLEQGFEKEKLDAINDETLLLFLEESLKLQDEEAGGTSTTTEATIDYDEVRRFLIELGVPEDEAYSLSNQEVEEILKTFK